MTAPALQPPELPEPAQLPAAPRGGRLRAAVGRYFGGLPGPFWVVFSGTVINRVGTMVVPFLVFYLGSRGISEGRTPYVLGALGAGGLAGPILGGWFADRVGRRPAILGGMVATALSQALLYLAPGFVTLALGAALLGAAANFHTPGVTAVIVDSASPERRQAAFGLYHWAINLGAAGAGALGGFLVDRGFWLLFLVDAVTCLGFAAVAWVALPHDRARPAHDGPRASGGYGVVLRDRLLLAFVGVALTYEFVYGQYETTVPMAIRDHGLPASTYGLAAVVNALVVVTMQPFANAWVLRFDRMRVWAVSATLIAVGIGLTGVAHTTTGYVLTVVVWSVGEVSSGGLATAVVADLAPADARARYQAALTWARGMARFLGLAVGPTLYAVSGPATLWWTVTAVGVAGAGWALLIGPALAARAKSTALQMV
ncbi:MFS transporter [Actinacidiphila sp. ITFR-21]|uniref:MFS transporter n=1 Tax=Actinacidiphila sp. ITFR-21 TaxID=3075199 RepID=UPI00288A8DD2|nr:MFS transporter [Streptomyces sp. ITFR-21]WNI14997.1 MFS transporter [Streptomyces sp. ITFR-21]